MGSYSSWSALQSAIRKDMRKAMHDTLSASKEDASLNQYSFYTQQRNPHVYVRTGAFGDSYRADYLGDNGDTSLAKIWLDYNYSYATQGISTHEIFVGAQRNLHMISGKPGTWEKTLKDIEKNIDTYFSKYFL